MQDNYGQLTDHNQQRPDEIDATVEMLGILTEQAHQNRRQDEKQDVADLETKTHTRNRGINNGSNLKETK